MTHNHKICITIPEEKIELIERMGLSATDVFYKGLQELLKQKYNEYLLLPEDDEDDTWDEPAFELIASHHEDRYSKIDDTRETN